MIDVAQDEYDFSFNHAFDDGVEEAGIETGGVGPCIAIAIVNHTQGWAGLLHADNLYKKDDWLQGFLDEAKTNCATSDNIEIWIGGGDNTEPGIRQTVDESRALAWKLLVSTFPMAPPPVWTNNPGQYFQIVVQTDPTELEVIPHTF